MTEKERSMNEAPLLCVKNLKKDFTVKSGRGKKTVHAVNDVSFEVYRGETFGLVGESGCGKTTTGRVISNLTEATDGEVLYKGIRLNEVRGRKLRDLRRDIQMVFQDPFASLDPRMTVGQSIEEPLRLNGIGDKQKRREMCEDFLEKVGLQRSCYSRYPHEFSGGQRQRIGIARALILHPELVVCDEPVSALDVSVQSQIINLLVSLQKELGAAYVFIAHDLNVVRYVSDWIGVMYLGNLVEVIRSSELFEHASHPYTRALLSAIPKADPEANAERIVLEGDIPSPTDPPTGCCFHTRCPYAKDKCATERPEKIHKDERTMVACHFPIYE